MNSNTQECAIKELIVTNNFVIIFKRQFGVQSKDFTQINNNNNIYWNLQHTYLLHLSFTTPTSFDITSFDLQWNKRWDFLLPKLNARFFFLFFCSGGASSSNVPDDMMEYIDPIDDLDMNDLEGILQAMSANSRPNWNGGNKRNQLMNHSRRKHRLTIVTFFIKTTLVTSLLHLHVFLLLEHPVFFLHS